MNAVAKSMLPLMTFVFDSDLRFTISGNVHYGIFTVEQEERFFSFLFVMLRRKDTSSPQPPSNYPLVLLSEEEFPRQLRVFKLEPGS